MNVKQEINKYKGKEFMPSQGGWWNEQKKNDNNLVIHVESEHSDCKTKIYIQRERKARLEITLITKNVKKKKNSAQCLQYCYLV